ncbi:MAG: WbqC family protein [Marinifilaceae bacterium]
MEQLPLLTTSYFSPIQVFSILNKCKDVYFEQFEHYGKQSYRNRCHILSANGVLALTVPVVKASNQKILTKDVRIDYATNWQKLHFKGIESAYKNSAFYDYYIDDFMPFFEQKETFLLDLNLKVLDTLKEFINIDTNIHLTQDYIRDNDQYIDLRNIIHPKASRIVENIEFTFTPKEYHQTFGQRFPFTPNLSILDLLFNEGPDAKQYL